MMSERSRISRGSRPRPLLVALAATSALLLGACGGGDSDDEGKSPPTPAPADAASTAGDPDADPASSPGTPDPADTPPVKSTPPAKTTAPTGEPTAPPASGRASTPASDPAQRSAATPRCTADHLALSLGRGDAGAGNRYAPLVFTNTGTTACALRGYPGVSMLDASGERIGHPAKRSGSALPPVELAPGRHAYAALHTVARGLTDKPCWPRAQRVNVYPPGSKQYLRAPARSFEVCGNTFDVSAVAPGKHP
ncbi:DUF4232 domain-containing protein [Streptomyces silvensis]|uniref:DUF4232 domain-containing protein n=1 Tax=Streptomyces silvensis TaxID=1765722 RepID=A0A0W7X2E0_9ACTN|nr:DUF4232 domain-containing protein [Streptomyces silvensis]KUF16914.1 hypothetical protein AT728_23565 [Streptomyces silvensis]